MRDGFCGTPAYASASRSWSLDGGNLKVGQQSFLGIFGRVVRWQDGCAHVASVSITEFRSPKRRSLWSVDIDVDAMITTVCDSDENSCESFTAPVYTDHQWRDSL